MVNLRSGADLVNGMLSWKLSKTRMRGAGSAGSKATYLLPAAGQPQRSRALAAAPSTIYSRKRMLWSMLYSEAVTRSNLVAPDHVRSISAARDAGWEQRGGR